LRQREDELEKAVRRQGEDERERGVLDRKERSKLQREMEILDKNYSELEQQRKREIMQQQEEYEKL
jgi:hypothetical protein